METALPIETFWIWYGASMAFFLLEAFGATGIGFLFAALSALCTGGLVQSGLIATDDHLMQAISFFGFTALWAAVLWKPLKKLRMQKPAQIHNDMIGRLAVVAKKDLKKKASGQATWSGTTMTARLADDAKTDIAKVGEELKIVDVRGSTLILAEEDYTHPTEETENEE